MKVAMVVSTDPAYDGRVKREARSLVAAGHEVTVFGVKRFDAPPDPLGFAVEHPPLPRWVGAGGPWNTMRNSASWFERMRPLTDAAIASKPDVLHAHDLDTVGPASAAAAKRGIPCIYDDHEASYVDKLPNYVPADAVGWKRNVLEAMTRRVQRRGEALERAVRGRGLAALVTVADALADRLVERFGGERPIVVRNCPMLRDVPRTDALRQRIGAPREARLLVYHGTATEGSGIETVIRALRLLPPQYVFALVGRVWSQEKYESLAREEGVADRVHFVPYVPEDEMLRLVASADVALVPTEPNSVGNTYGVPNKFFESMLVGVPIVASDTPGVAPLLQRTGAGLLYPWSPPRAPTLLAAAVRRLCDDRVAWERCRAAGRTAVRQELNWDKESEKLLAIYERLAPGSGG